MQSVAIPKPQVEHITLRGYVNNYTGYGQLLLETARLLQAHFPLHVSIYPLIVDDRGFGSSVPLASKQAFVFREQPEEFQLIIATPSYSDPNSRRKLVIFTMWETTKLPPSYVKTLNRAEAIIVPSVWVRENFIRSGVIKPIYLVPLFSDTEVFKFAPYELSAPCVFGTAGRLAHGGIRKGFDAVTKAFAKAFPRGTEQAFLRVKCFPDCKTPVLNDSRIQILKLYLSNESLAAWYHSLTAFVSGSASEGWGLHQQQAMLCGRPVIGVDYGGVKEFFNPSNGYPVKHTEVLSSMETYSSVGSWARPSVDSMAEQMLKVFLDRGSVVKKSLLARESAERFSTENFLNKLIAVLSEIKFLKGSYL